MKTADIIRRMAAEAVRVTERMTGTSTRADLHRAFEMFLRAWGVCTIVVYILQRAPLSEGPSWLSVTVLMLLYVPSVASYVAPLSLFWTVLRARGAFGFRVLAQLTAVVSTCAWLTTSIVVPEANRAYRAVFTEGIAALVRDSPKAMISGDSEVASSVPQTADTYRAKVEHSYRWMVLWLCVVAALAAGVLASTRRFDTLSPALVATLLTALFFDGFSAGFDRLMEYLSVQSGRRAWAAAAASFWIPALLVLATSIGFALKSQMGEETPRADPRRPQQYWASRVFGLVVVGVGAFLCAIELSRAFPDHVTVIVALAIGLTSIAVWGLIVVPRWQTEKLSGSDMQLFTAEAEARKVMAQLLGGCVVVGSVYVASLQIQNGQKALEVASLSQAQEFAAQRNERFAQAIAQLGSSAQPDVQVGAIFALEKFAEESENDTMLIVRTLAAFVRRNSPWPASKGKGIEPLVLETAMRAIGHIPRPQGMYPYSDFTALLPEPFDLSHADLRDLDMSGADFRSVSFESSNLSGSTFSDVQLKSASFRNATFRDGRISAADDNPEMWFNFMDLTGTTLHGRFSTVFLEWSVLRGAALTFSANSMVLTGSDLSEAWIEPHLKDWEIGEPSSLRYASFATDAIPDNKMKEFLSRGAVRCKVRSIFHGDPRRFIFPEPSDPAGPSPTRIREDAETIRLNCPDIAGLTTDRVISLVRSWTQSRK